MKSKIKRIKTKKELIKKLNEIREEYIDDPADAHYAADGAVLDFINDKKVTEAFVIIEKWYE